MLQRPTFNRRQTMNVVGIVLILSGIACQASFTVLRRYVIREKINSERDILVWGLGLAGVILASGIWWWPQFGTEKTDWPVFWIAVAGTTLANIVIQFSSTRAASLGDASLTAPIQGMTPLLITAAALSVNEYPSQIGMAGIVLIGLGTWIHNREKATTLTEYLVPLRMLWLPANYDRLRGEERVTVQNDMRAVRWAFLSACIGTIGLLFDGILSRSGSVAEGTAIEWLAVSLAFSMLIRPKPGAQKVVSGSKRTWGIALYGLLWAGHAILIVNAFRFAPVAYIGSLKRLAIILIVAMSWALLGERKALRRLIPAGIIGIGAMLLVFDPASHAIVDKAHVFLQSWVE